MQVNDREMVKSLFNPKRVRILRQVGNKEKTVKGIAEALDDKPSRLYYHVNQLVDQGLLEVVSTKQVGHLTEKYYKAAAVEEYDLSDELVNNNKDFVMKQTLVQVNRAIEALETSIENGSVEDLDKITGQASILQAELTNEEWHKLNAEIRKLIHEWEERSGKDGKENKQTISYILMSYVDEESN